QRPFPEPVKLLNMTYGGSGCPQSTLSGVLDSDNGSLVLTYSNYSAETGQGAPSKRNNAKCQININLATMQNYTMSIYASRISGSMKLEGQILAQYKSTWYVSGSSPQVSGD